MSKYMHLKVSVVPYYQNDLRDSYPNLARQLNTLAPDLVARNLREFLVGAAHAECGMEAVDPDMYNASVNKEVVTTPAGMVLNGQKDVIEAPPTNDPNADPDGDGVKNEMPTSIVDFLEFYLLNYFAPATYKQTPLTELGRKQFMKIGCGNCHIPDLQINHDRRLANLTTVYDPAKGIFNKLFATVTAQFVEQPMAPASLPSSSLRVGHSW